MGSLALVAVPTAVLIALLAYSLFKAAVADLQANQAATTVSSASMLLSWLDAAGQSLANEAYAAGDLDAKGCARLASAFLRRNPGFSSVRLLDQTGAPCAAGEALAGVDLPPTSPPERDDRLAFQVIPRGSRLLILSAARPGSPFPLLVVDDRTLKSRLSGAYGREATEAALVLADKFEPIDPALTQANWFPSSFEDAKPKSVWRCPDRTGASASFAFAPIGAYGVAVLMRFDGRALAAAERRLAILCLALTTMLGLLAYVYAATIRRDIVFWVHGLDLAARAGGDDPETLRRAPVSNAMPSELRSVAESFNTMADRMIERRHALQTSLDENRALMLEMHHRIKNSLQVIQSYLALIRRSAPRPEVAVLARVEARVGVLAIAYRLALTPKGMRPIAVKPFLEEICAATVGGLRRPRQRVAYAIGWDGEIVVDRAIPLGLGVVEALIAALGAGEAGYIGVNLGEVEGEVELRVESDAAPAEPGLPEKVMRGLANQLGAAPTPAGAGEILFWRFPP